MTEPYDWPDPTPPARAPRFLVYVALFAVGFAGVLAFLALRAPSSLVVVPPTGYVRLSDAESGGGEMSAARTARHLGIAAAPGFERGVLRAYGRPPGEPPRAVLVLVVDSSEPRALLDAAVAAIRARGGTEFAVRPGAVGFHDVPDAQGRHVQRVLWAQGDLFTVVSLLTPERDDDTAEVVEISREQIAF